MKRFRRRLRPRTRKRGLRTRKRGFRKRIRRSKHVRMRVDRPYLRQRMIADREHVKLVCLMQPDFLTFAEVGIGKHWHTGKIKLNSIEKPGNDFNAGLAAGLPIHYPIDMFQYQSRYQKYRVTGCLLEIWVSSWEARMDNDDLLDFTITVTPLNWTNTGPGSSSPLTSFEHAVSQPYTTVHRIRNPTTGRKPVYIRRYCDVAKIYGEVAGYVSTDWSGNLNPILSPPSNPPRLSHWHLGFAHINNNAADGVLRMNFQVKMTYFATLSDKRIVPDPDIPSTNDTDFPPVGLQGPQGIIYGEGLDLMTPSTVDGVPYWNP